MKHHRSDLHGILLVDKPAGLTSADVVRYVKRRLGGAKVGHLGTLDPFATGLLPLCIGEGSKVVPFLNQEDKVYEGTLRLGTATDTLDSTGRTTDSRPVLELREADLAAVAGRFRGEMEQTPPMFSAVKQGGVPLYQLARRGVVVEREARRVTVWSLELAPGGAGEIFFRVRCSKGTYVRVLAAEVATALGTVGHLTRLRRTAFGRFEVSASVAPDRIGSGGPMPLVTLRQCLPELRELSAGAALERRIRLGQQAALGELAAPTGEGETAKAIAGDGSLVAIVRAEGGAWQILRVFSESRITPGAPAST